MSVKIRLQRHGRKARPFYHIVAADARSPRDGRFIERLGSYNPVTNPATIDIDVDKAVTWLQNGAQPTDTARRILSYTGVLYKKHLLRGVSKGALTMEQVEKMFQEWLDAKSNTISAKSNDLATKANKAKADRLAVEAKMAAEKAAALEAKLNPVVEEAPAEEVAEEAPAAEEAATEETASEEGSAE